MPRAGGQGYVAAQAGALLGGADVAVVAFAGFQVLVVPTLFQEDRPLEVWAATSMFACGIAAAAGCALTLRRRGHHTAGLTALLLFVVLLVISVVLWWSSGTALQSSLYPYGFVLALVSPLIAGAVALRLAGP